jgi:hypothetical protein
LKEIETFTKSNTLIGAVSVEENSEVESKTWSDINDCPSSGNEEVFLVSKDTIKEPETDAWTGVEAIVKKVSLPNGRWKTEVIALETKSAENTASAEEDSTSPNIPSSSCNDPSQTPQSDNAPTPNKGSASEG